MLRVNSIIEDRYEILEQIGTGGMSEVYRGKDHKLDRYVAIKVLKEEFCADSSFVAKFRAEAQSVARLSHQYIVSIYDVGDYEDLHYIVMELVEGITLKDYIERKGKLGMKEAADIAIKVAEGLACAHDQNIVHRDIKPQNIAVSKDGKIKVMDFGICRAVSGDTNTNATMGSVHYISPEQARGGYCDNRSDIYSLGITMYEMVTGRVPFDGDTTVAVALAHLQNDIIPPREIDPSISPVMEKIIMKCTMKKPDRRYSSAKELIADLKKALRNPNDDFVVIPPASNDNPTVAMSPEEVSAIRMGARKIAFEEGENSSSSYGMMASGDSGADMEETEKPDNKSLLDPEDEEEKGSVFDKIILIAGIVIALAIIVLGIFIVLKIKGVSSSSDVASKSASELQSESIPEGKVKMPDVYNKTKAEAQKLLNEAELSASFSEDSSETVPKGNVMLQEFEPNTLIDKHTKVMITLSKGSSKLKVPDSIIGRKAEEAKRILEDLGLQATIIKESNETVKEGYVIRSDKDGKSVQEGDTVILYVSSGTNVEKHDLINLKGKTVEEATKLLNDMNLKLVVDTSKSAYSDEYDEGVIMDQNLPPNTSLAEGSEVIVVISKGKTPVRIQDVSNLPEATAKSLLEAQGFVVEIEKEDNSVYKEGCAIRTNPAAMTEYKKGSTVTLYIASNEDKELEVPDVSNSDQQTAIRTLQAMGFVVAISNAEEYSNTIPEGRVLRSEPSAGTKLKKGETVILVLSSGSAPVSMVNLVGMSESDAKNMIQSMGLNYGGASTQNGSSPAGTVLDQSIRVGTPVEKGATITLVLASGSNVFPTITNNMTEANVRGLLNEYGFRNIEMNYSPSSLAEEGCVYEVNIPGYTGTGQVISLDTKITVYVSTGSSAPEPEPTVNQNSAQPNSHRNDRHSNGYELSSEDDEGNMYYYKYEYYEDEYPYVQQ